MSGSARIRRRALLAILVGVGAGPVQAVVLDDFTVGSTVLFGPTESTQIGLDPAHVIGGSRRFQVGQFGAGSVAAVSGGQLILTSSGWGYLQIEYGDPIPLGGRNLTSGGHDRLRLRLGEVGGGSRPLGIYLNRPPTSSDNGVTIFLHESWDDAVIEIPYSSFPAMAFALQTMTLDLVRNPEGTSLAIEEISTAGPPLAGDLNRDGVVNGGDLSTWTQFLGTTTATSGFRPYYLTADANRDGTVDGADLIEWQRRETGAVAAGRPSPEPTAAALAILAAAGAMRLGRRSRLRR